MDLLCQEDSVPMPNPLDDAPSDDFSSPERDAMTTTSVEALLAILERAVSRMRRAPARRPGSAAVPPPP